VRGGGVLRVAGREVVHLVARINWKNNTCNNH
jgi:hypothetical protein